MKTTTLLVILLSMAAVSTVAQDPKGGQVLGEAQAAKQKPVPKALVAPAKPGSEVPGKRVFYAGFFTDFLRAEKKRPLLSLKTPIDPVKDLENIWFYPGTDRPQGVVLFSVKF